MPAPIIAGAAALAGNKKVQQVIGSVVSTVSNQVHQDNLFIDARDKTFAALRANGFPESEWGAYTKNVAHTAVPDRKIGGTFESHYGPFYQLLFNDVQNYLNSKRPGMGDFFMMENQRIAQELPFTERFKGSPWNAVNSAADKYKNMGDVTELINATDGLGIGQAFVSNGQVKIPNAPQAGDGIFSGLQNLGATLLSSTIANTGINGGQVMSQPAAGISGQQQLAASSGGVVLTGGVSVGGSVTKNTTSGGSSSSAGGGMLVIGLVIAAAVWILNKMGIIKF
jgi:hypothetical protein